MIGQRPPSEAGMAEFARHTAKKAENEFNDRLIMTGCGVTWEL